MLEHLRARIGWVLGDAHTAATLVHSAALGDTVDVEDEFYEPLFRTFEHGLGVLRLLDAALGTCQFDVERLGGSAPPKASPPRPSLPTRSCGGLDCRSARRTAWRRRWCSCAERTPRGSMWSWWPKPLARRSAETSSLDARGPARGAGSVELRRTADHPGRTGARGDGVAPGQMRQRLAADVAWREARQAQIEAARTERQRRTARPRKQVTWRHAEVPDHPHRQPAASRLIDRAAPRSRGRQATPASTQHIAEAVKDAVQRQVDAGVDVVNDGEMGKIGYSTYVTNRLTGFARPPSRRAAPAAGPGRFPDLDAVRRRRVGSCAMRSRPSAPATSSRRTPRRSRPTSPTSKRPRRRPAPSDVFMSAASPGVVAFFIPNQHYGNHEAYLAAHRRGDAAGVPRHRRGRHHPAARLPGPGDGRHRVPERGREFRQRGGAERRGAEPRAARTPARPDARAHLLGQLRGPAPPRHRAAATSSIWCCRRTPRRSSLEACNPRHAHEWRVFEDVKLPEGTVPRAGRDRLDEQLRRAPGPGRRALAATTPSVVGAERVMAGSDCGFGTFAGVSNVAPSVVWAKFGSMAEGARRAAERVSSRVGAATQ